jgi:hypothetical protein
MRVLVRIILMKGRIVKYETREKVLMLYLFALPLMMVLIQTLHFQVLKNPDLKHTLLVFLYEV